MFLSARVGRNPAPLWAAALLLGTNEVGAGVEPEVRLLVGDAVPLPRHRVQAVWEGAHMGRYVWICADVYGSVNAPLSAL